MKWSEPPLRWIFSTLHAQPAAHLPQTTLLSSSPATKKTFQQINFTHSLLFGVFTVILASNKTEGAVDWIQTVHLWDCCSGLWAQKPVGTSCSRWCRASSFTCMYPWMGCGQSMEARMHRETFRVWFLQTLIDCLLKIDNNPSNKKYTRHGNLQTPTRCSWRRASTLTVDTIWWKIKIKNPANGICYFPDPHVCIYVALFNNYSISQSAMINKNP
jgi:hypothetical protein